MKVLSIIIPSYNTSSFMDRSLQTFIDERLNDSVELLIVNDGSKDDTSEKAHKYENKYSDLIRVIDKENGGHGSVINRGAQEAKGKYVKVVDGDDWVETDNLVQLLDMLNTCDCDVVLNPYFTVDVSNNDKKKFLDLPVKEGEYKFEDISEKIAQFQIHTMTIKTDILRKVRLTENCFYEDFQYDLFPVPYVETVRVLNFPVYDYLIGQKSQSVSDQSVLKNHLMEQKILFDSIKYYEEIKDSLNIEKKKFFIKNICTLSRQAYNIYLRNYKTPDSYREFKKFDQRYQKVSPYFYQKTAETNKYIGFIRKGGTCVFDMTGKILKAYKSIK